MTHQETQKIMILQRQGLGYKRIAAQTGLSVNTVKSYCRAHPITSEGIGICSHCGKEIDIVPHRKQKKFCSDSCRMAWWAKHPEMRKDGKGYEHSCRFCRKGFFSDRPGSKYCSVQCFADARRKVPAV